jgi:hypothetical protein
MKKPFTSTMLFISLLFVSCASRMADQDIGNGNTFTGHPALEILKQYHSEVGNNRVTVVIPYIVNLMALDLLKEQTHLEVVKAYIDWYLDHLNYPDKYGATGSIYDYRVYADGREESLESADSLDSYAATFIMLINRYYDLSEDRQLMESNRKKIEDIIYLIPYLQDHDGLTVALPGTTGKYLMDNCEALGGVSAFVELAGKLGWSLQSFYRERKTVIRDAILAHFYNGNTGNFYWLIDGPVKTPSSWSLFYPDSYAQLFPILYGVVQNQNRKNALWEPFHQDHQDILTGIPVEQRIVYLWTKEVMDNENND